MNGWLDEKCRVWSTNDIWEFKMISWAVLTEITSDALFEFDMPRPKCFDFSFEMMIGWLGGFYDYYHCLIKKKGSESKILTLTQIFMWNVFSSLGIITEFKVDKLSFLRLPEAEPLGNA